MAAAVAPPRHEHPPVLQDDGGRTVARHVEGAGERPGAGHRIEDFGRAADGRLDAVVESSAAAGPRTGAAGVSVRSQLAIAKIVARYTRARACCGDAFINSSYRLGATGA